MPALFTHVVSFQLGAAIGNQTYRVATGMRIYTMKEKAPKLPKGGVRKRLCYRFNFHFIE
jgi:hypothetical protein